MDIIISRVVCEENISGAPVVDKSGKLLGVVKEEGVIFRDKKCICQPLSISVSVSHFGTDRYMKK